uniref:Transposase Tc1-like domain-containing protein n=1 Tax=Anabas testudineus TaxID=64144 RepID=A0A3Q1I713_ANATE
MENQSGYKKEGNCLIRAIAQTLAIASSTTWNILKKKEATGGLSNRSVDNRNTVRAVKKDPKTTVSDINNNFQRAGVKTISEPARKIRRPKIGICPKVLKLAFYRLMRQRLTFKKTKDGFKQRCYLVYVSNPNVNTWN